MPGVKFPCTLAKGIIFASWPKYSNSISIHSLEMAMESNRALSVSHDSPVGSDFTVRKYFVVTTSPPRETWICPLPVSHHGALASMCAHTCIHLHKHVHTTHISEYC